MKAEEVGVCEATGPLSLCLFDRNCEKVWIAVSASKRAEGSSEKRVGGGYFWGCVFLSVRACVCVCESVCETERFEGRGDKCQWQTQS